MQVATTVSVSVCVECTDCTVDCRLKIMDYGLWQTVAVE